MNTRSNQEMNSFKQTIYVNKSYASSHDQVFQHHFVVKVSQHDFVVYYPVTVISISCRAEAVVPDTPPKFNRTWC